jgi:acyl-CoA synthetase (NDP forming)
MDEVDFLLELENDDFTKVIAIYLENIKRLDLFLEIAKRVNQNKKIIIFKSGTSNI